MIRTIRRDGGILYWVLGVLAIAAIALYGGFRYMRENPLALYEKSTRRALQKANMELQYFDSRVGKLAYWEAGAGPTIVLLHGVGDQAGAFQGIVESLTPDYRVIIPDLPGHGESEPAAGNLSMTTVYAGVEELLATEAGGDPVTLVGSSMGAWVATLYAHRNPDRADRVIAINGGPLRGDRTDLSLTPVDREAARTLMAALRDPSSPPTPDFVLDDIVEQSASGPIGRMVAEWKDLEAHLLEGKLHEVETPVDLLWGESDQLMTLAYAERMASQLPRARITVIEKCGHHPANECPAKLAARLGEVLRMEPPPLPEPAEVEEVAGEEVTG